MTVLAMAAALTRRGDRAGAGREALGRGRLVVRAGARSAAATGTCATWSSPATRCPRSSTWGRSRCRTPSGCRRRGPTSASLHYATDTGVWRDYFVPGLHDAFGALWPLVVVGAVAGGAAGARLGPRPGRALDRRRRPLRPPRLPLHAAQRRRRRGRTGRLRDQHPLRPAGPAGGLGAAAAAAVPRRPAAPVGAAGGPARRPPRHRPRRRRPPRPARASSRCWSSSLAVAGARRRCSAPVRAPRRQPVVVVGGFAALALLVVAIGYPVQRHYLGDRFATPARTNDPRHGPRLRLPLGARHRRRPHRPRRHHRRLPRLRLLRHRPLQRVLYLGARGPHGAFNAIPTCAAFRAAVNAADLDYLVTAPFLNFIHPGEPIPSPEAGWLRGEPAVEPILRSGRSPSGRCTGRLDPAACGPANAPPARKSRQQPAILIAAAAG